MEGLLNESPTYDTSHLTRSHRETKCWPVVSCELIGSAAICIYSYRKQCCRPYTHTYAHTRVRTHTHTHTPPPPHTTQSPHTRNAHTTSRGPLCLAVLAGPDWLHEWHTHTRTHTHTHTHTHTYTRAYSAGKCTNAATNMHSKQALSSEHEI